MSRDSLAKHILSNKDKSTLPHKTKIAIYARVSLDRQVESVEHQVALLREVAKARNLGECPDEFIYEDEGISASKHSIWTRPAMKNLLAAAKQGKFQIIMFKGISRFARSTQEALEVLERLKTQGLRVISYEENYDSEKENSNFMFTMHAAIAEYEAEKIGIRVRLGNKAKAQSGMWVGMAPDGYKLIDRKLVVDEKRKYIIKKIFDLYIEGFGSFKISEYLNKRGWLTSNGKLWCSKSIRDILNNEVYVGKIVYNKTHQYRVRDYDSEELGKKKWVRDYNSVDEWVIVENAHEPIIDLKIFEKAQSILNKRRYKKEAPRVYHPLTGILYCGICGQGMVCQKRSTAAKTYRYYICKTYHKFGREYCDQANTNADILEQKICQLLKKKFSKVNREIIGTKLTIIDINTSGIEKELKTIKLKLEKVNKDRSDLYFERDKMTCEQYNFIAKRLMDDANRLTVQSQELECKLKNKQNNKKLSEEIKKYIDNFFEFGKQDISKLRYLVHYFVERIELEGQRLDIKYRFEI
ncbi:recombinase family protein [Desulfolucanica intricata]|uniref:recombinase family protein n=1 Tax=Desulfolucanica intricata TaxID=1285191 RepID=UPI00083518BC|nr:recombinase family protein [Desulfolucanica intricata]